MAGMMAPRSGGSTATASGSGGGFNFGANGNFQLGPFTPLGTGPTVSSGGLSPFSIFDKNGQVDPALAALALQQNSQSLSADEFNAGETDKRSVLNSLMQAFGNFNASGTSGGPNSVTAPVISDPTIGMPAGGYDASAETAAYARAKDASAQALQGALKGLHNTMAARGITGSGIEGKATEGLYQNAEEDIANTGRELASTEAGQAFTSGESAKTRATDIAKTNAANNLTAQQSNQSANLTAQQIAGQRLTSLLSTFGSLY